MIDIVFFRSSTESQPFLPDRRINCTKLTAHKLLKWYWLQLLLTYLIEPTVLAVLTLSFNEPLTLVTVFLIESEESVSLKGLKFFRKFCKFLQLLLSLTIFEFPLPSFISVFGTNEQLDSFSMPSVTSANYGRENTNKFLRTLLIPFLIVNPPSQVISRMSVYSTP